MGKEEDELRKRKEEEKISTLAKQNRKGQRTSLNGWRKRKISVMREYETVEITEMQ